MAGTFYSRAVERPITLADRASGAVLTGQLESVKLLVPDAGPRELVVVVWFDYWMWKRIDRGHLFGYTFESIDRDGFTSWELSSDQRVQLELRAEGAARAALDELDGEALLDRAVAGLCGDDPGSPLTDCGNYHYLAVYRQVQQGSASYLTGFTSVYRKQA